MYPGLQSLIMDFGIVAIRCEQLVSLGIYHALQLL